MTSGVVRTGVPEEARAATVGRPPWWAIAGALLVGVVVTVDLLGGGVLEAIDLRTAEVVASWGLRDSAAYPLFWLLTQAGGRGFLLAVLAYLVGWLAYRQRTLRPLLRVLVALGILTVVVYGLKYGTGRTAPAYPGSYFHRGGASYPSGHVANAVLMWGVARWQAVEYCLAASWQRALRLLSLFAPVATGLAMVSLNFHWVTDAIVGAALGVVLLGVVHALDAHVLSRWVRARAGRQSA